MPDISDALREEGVRFVRFVWCDNANVLRAKAVHIDILEGALEHGVGISPAQQAVPVTQDAFVAESGLGPVGEIRLTGDWDTLAHLPFAPGQARVMGDMVLDGQPWPYCPRYFLTRMVERGREMGFTFQAAFENEFYLLERDERGVSPTDNTLFCSVQAFNRNVDFIDDLSSSLLAQSIPVANYYPESGHGQHEMSVGHTDPVGAADRQLAFRETVHAVAHQYGYLASFLPKIFPDQAGSGSHLHLSLWKDGKNVTGDEDGLSAHGRSFVAGVLEHLPALMAITTPIPNSYRRLGPHLWSGAFSCWGYDNREAAVRVPTHPADGVSNLEVKTLDSTANPYLALGAILAAGLDGLARNLQPSPPMEVDPGLLDEEERRRNGIERLPDSLEKSLEHFKSNRLLVEAMGSELFRAFKAVREEEWKALSNLSPEQELELLLERY